MINGTPGHHTADHLLLVEISEILKTVSVKVMLLYEYLGMNLLDYMLPDHCPHDD